MIELIASFVGSSRLWFPILLVIGFCLFLLVPFAKFGLRHERKLLNPVMWFAVLGLAGALIYYGYRVGGAAVLVVSAGYWLIMLITKHGVSFLTVEAGRIWLFNAGIFLAFFVVTDMASAPHRKLVSLESRSQKAEVGSNVAAEVPAKVEKASDQLWR